MAFAALFFPKIMPFESLQTAAHLLLVAAVSLGVGVGQSMRGFGVVPLAISLVLHIAFWVTLARWAKSTHIDFLKKFPLLLGVGVLLLVAIFRDVFFRLRWNRFVSLFYTFIVAIYPVYVIQKLKQRGTGELPTYELVITCYLVDMIIVHSVRDFYIILFTVG